MSALESRIRTAAIPKSFRIVSDMPVFLACLANPTGVDLMNVLNELSEREVLMAASATAQDRQSVSPKRSLTERLEALCNRDMSFIANESFSPRTTIKPCSEWEQLRRKANGRNASGRTGRIGSDDLLTPVQEVKLFLRMNFLKFRAAAITDRLSSTAPNDEKLARAEAIMAEAEAIRNHLITANMRLVMSIAKKYATPQHSFDELVSEGTLTLMHAVDKFDADRGFRFSTYAYRSIVRTIYRCLMEAQKERQRVSSSLEEPALEEADETRSSVAIDQVWQDVRDLAYSMLDQLDRRERFIIRSRYALGSHRKARSFQYLANKLGISKERARQLESRAVKKLRAIAEGYDRDELFGAALS